MLLTAASASAYAVLEIRTAIWKETKMRRQSIFAGAIVLLTLSPSVFAGIIVGCGQDDHGEASPPAGNDFVAIATGWRHALALKSDSNASLVAWGWNCIAVKRRRKEVMRRR